MTSGQVAKNAAVDGQELESRIGRALYPVRVTGWLLASWSVVLAHGRTIWSEPALWVPLLIFNLYPHVGFLHYRLRGSLRRAEFLTLIGDMVLIGLLAGLLEYNPVIALPYAIANSATNYSVRGLKLLLRGIAAWLFGLALALLVFDFVFDPQTTLPGLVPSYLYLILATHYVGYLSYTRGRARLRAQAAEEEASRAKSDFLANMSHELRTPMNAIIGLADLCWEGELSPGLRDRISRIRSASRALLAVIEDVLDFSRINTQRVDLEPQAFDLRAVLEQLTDLVGHAAVRKGLDFLVEVDHRVPTCLVGDSHRLSQVLANLANNAFKFTSEGEIVVRVTRIGKAEKAVRLRFSVTDTGIGIPDGAAGELFEAFTRTDGSSTREHGGAGLGLAIASRLVELMDSRLELDSQVGCGSTFSFEIVLQEASDEHLEPRLEAPPEILSRRVLIVEANPRYRSILEEMLVSGRFHSVAKDNAGAALDLLATAQDIGLVLIAWDLPDMNGIELSRRIRQARPEIGRIVLVSARDRDHAEAATAYGEVEAILTRPFGPSRLLQNILTASGCESSHPGLRSARSVAALDTIGGAHVLVVDDDETNRLVARGILEAAGVEVELVESGSEAVAITAGESFDAVLMDLHMPEMDGHDATRQIRHHPHLGDLPIIAMTADARTETRERSRESGINATVSKPIEATVLLETLVRWIRLPKDRRRGTPPEASASPTTLPAHLRGVDLAAALERIGGRHDLLGEALRSFARTFAATTNDLAEHLDRGEHGAALELLHRLKGAAGNLSATGVHTLSVELERALRSGHADTERSLERLKAELETVVTACSGLAATSLESPPSVSLESIRPRLDELATLLKQRSFRARRLYRELAPMLEGAAGTEELRRLEAEMGRLDFDAARRRVLRLSGIAQTADI